MCPALLARNTPSPAIDPFLLNHRRARDGSGTVGQARGSRVVTIGALPLGAWEDRTSRG